jgi:hypothetical protein
MSTPNQITGGAFNDVLGNPLANGYLILELNQDATVTASTTTQVCAGSTIKVPLNSNGNVVTSPAYSFWTNDDLTPTTTGYLVTAYTASGQRVWGPSLQYILASPSPFDIGAWVPN